jgi:hypothetical protein
METHRLQSSSKVLLKVKAEKNQGGKKAPQ